MHLFILKAQRDLDAMLAFIAREWQKAIEEGRPLAVEIARDKDRPSSAQQRLLGAMLGDIADQFHPIEDGRRMSYSKDALREYFKRRLIGVEELPGGQVRALSTSTLDRDKMGEFIDDIRLLAQQEMGVRFIER